jgi:four helix bundle protein
MDSYKASKAWHIGQELAREVYHLVKQLPNDGSNVPGNLRKTSVAIPLHIAASVTKKAQKEKLECYVQAREAVIQLQDHLKLAKSVDYIEHELHRELAEKAIEAQNLLTFLIRKLSYELAAAKE